MLLLNAYTWLNMHVQANLGALPAIRFALTVRLDKEFHRIYFGLSRSKCLVESVRSSANMPFSLGNFPTYRPGNCNVQSVGSPKR